MYKLLLAAALFISPVCFSQDSGNVRQEDTSATQKAIESTQHFLDSIKTANSYKEISQGLDNLMRYQKDQRDQQRRKAFLYIGLGLFFLVVFVVGIMRRTKSKLTK